MVNMNISLCAGMAQNSFSLSRFLLSQAQNNECAQCKPSIDLKSLWALGMFAFYHWERKASGKWHEFFSAYRQYPNYYYQFQAAFFLIDQEPDLKK
jgi:hypothetical protein